MSKNTELHEMSLRRLALLSAMEGSAETSPEVEEKEKAASSPLNTDVEVNIQPQPPNKAGASQISLKTDSCIETIEITTDKSTTQYLTNRNRAEPLFLLTMNPPLVRSLPPCRQSSRCLFLDLIIPLSNASTHVHKPSPLHPP